MSNLVKNTTERSYRARGDRRFTQGRIIAVNDISHTAIVDVGAQDAEGNACYVTDVYYSPQAKPQVGDQVKLAYGNISPHSLYIAGMVVGGSNSGGIVQSSGVDSIAKSGSAKLKGDVVLSEGTGIALTQVGQNIAVAFNGTVPLTANSDPVDVGAAAVRGADTTHFANDDHVHKGVHSLAKAAGTPLYGDVTLSEGANVTITPSGNNLAIASAITPLCTDPPSPVMETFSYTTGMLDNLYEASTTNMDAHTSDSTHTWTNQNVSDHYWKVYSDGWAEIDAGAVNGWLIYSNYAPAGDDYSVFSTVYCAGVLGTTWMSGVVARYYPTGGYGYAAGYDPSDNKWHIWKYSGYTYTSLVTGSSPAMVTGGTYTIEFKLTGSLLELRVNGVSVCACTDTTYSGGAGKRAVGIFGGKAHPSGSDGGHWHFLDFKCPSAVAVTPGASAGTSTYASRCDHTHEGVHSVAPSGGAQLLGDVTIGNGGGVVVAQSGQNITIAVGGRGSKAISGATGLTTAEVAYRILEFTGSLVSPADVTITAAMDGREWIVYNNTGQTITFKVSGQTGVAVANGKRAIVYCNATDIVRVTPDT